MHAEHEDLTSSQPVPPLILPFVVMAAAAVILTVMWDSIPARWASHWGADGQVNGWSERSFLSVYGPLLAGAGICLFLEGLGQAALRLPFMKDDRIPAAHARAVHAVLGHMTLTLMRFIEIGLGLLFAMLSIVLPLSAPKSGGGLAVVALGLVVTSVVVGVVAMARQYRRAVENGAFPKLEGFNGFIYRNPKDSRLLVPKLVGYGTTLNFAHPMAWPLMALVVGLPIALTLLVPLLAR